MSGREEVVLARKALLNGGGGLSYFEDRGLTRDTVARAFVGYEPEVYFLGKNGQGYKGPGFLYPCIGGGRLLGIHYKSQERDDNGKRRQKWGGYADDLPRKGHGKEPDRPAKIIPFGMETLEDLGPDSRVVLCGGEEDALSMRQAGFTVLSQPGAGLLEPVYAAELRGSRSWCSTMPERKSKPARTRSSYCEPGPRRCGWSSGHPMLLTERTSTADWSKTRRASRGGPRA
jgi:hypothetical protein